MQSFLLNKASRVKCFLSSQQYAPLGTDFIGYNSIIDFFNFNSILNVEGDIVEIGTFLGGGALKISKYIRGRSAKRLFIIDVFDPNFDWTKSTDGQSMASIYRDALSRYKGKTQFEIFSKVTRICRNIQVIKADSKKVQIPASKLCFALIDGNHDPEYVENDFYLVWDKLSVGGAVAFHDYGGPLPQTTAKIKELMTRHNDQIFKVFQEKQKWLVYLIKK